VEDVAAIHESNVGDEAFAYESRQSQLGALAQQ